MFTVLVKIKIRNDFVKVGMGISLLLFGGTAPSAIAQGTSPHVDSVAELQGLIDAEWNETIIRLLTPGEGSWNHTIPLITFDPAAMDAAFLASLVARVEGAITVFPLKISEDQTANPRVRHWESLDENLVQISAVPAGYVWTELIESAVGTAPPYATAAWWAERDPGRMVLNVSLLDIADLQTYLDQTTYDPAPPLEAPVVWTNPEDALNVAAIHRSGTDAAALYIEGPAAFNTADVWRSSLLESPAWYLDSTWSLGSRRGLALVNAGADPRMYLKVSDTFKDSDMDGLSDGREQILYGTNAFTTDTDGDGLSDGEELFQWGTDPDTSDSDGDGLSDGEEVNQYDMDPNNGDSDGDGIPDLAEAKPANVWGDGSQYLRIWPES